MSIETDFQAYLAWPLYVLMKMDRTWRPLPELLPDLLLTEIVMQIPDNKYYDPAEHLVYCQLIRPLESLGMLEVREVKFILLGDALIHVTPLLLLLRGLTTYLWGDSTHKSSRFRTLEPLRLRLKRLFVFIDEMAKGYLCTIKLGSFRVYTSKAYFMSPPSMARKQKA